MGIFRKSSPQLTTPEVVAPRLTEIGRMVEGPNILIQSRYGPFFVNRHDSYIGRSMQVYGEYSPGEMACFSQWVRPGSVAVEVGANIGAFSVGLSRLLTPSGTLFVFEPQRRVFQLLCANLAINQCSNTHTYQYGLGPAASVMHVPLIDYASHGNFGGVALGPSGSEPVVIYPLDRWGLNECDFMKIDVEGMEADVLRGAELTIRRCRPVIYLEDDREAAHPELVALLESYAYDLYWHVPPLFTLDNFNGVKEDVLSSTYSVNLLCLPKERQTPRDTQRDIRTYGRRWDSWKDLPGDYP